MTAATDSAIQQSTVNDMPKRGGKKEEAKSQASKSPGLHYFDTSYPKVIRKTTQPSLKEEVNILFDFGMPNGDELLITEKLDKMLNGLLQDDSRVARYWFNDWLDGQKLEYQETFWFILNLKATLLNPVNANLLKEWRLSDKVPPQDIQEVGTIASLYERKKGTEKIIDLNTRALKEYVLKDTDKRNLELRKEIILNIALGNLGGLYQELIVRKDKADSAKVEQAA
jgi:hypothetical protein